MSTGVRETTVVHAKDSRLPTNPVVVAVGLIVLTTNILVPTLVGVYVDHFGLTVSAAGYSAAIYMGGGGLGAALVGWQLLKVRTSALLAAALIALVLGNMASIFTHSFSGILAVRMLAGLGEGAGFALMAAGVSRMRNPNRVYGVFQVLLLLLATGIQLGIPWLRSHLGPQMLFVPIAVAPACLLLFIRRFPDLTRSAEFLTPKYVTSARLPFGFYRWCGVFATLTVYTAYGAMFAYVERVGVWADVPADNVAQILGMGYAIGVLGGGLAIVTASWRGRIWAVFIASALVILSTVLAMNGTTLAYQIGVPALFFSWFYFAPNLLGVLSVADPSGRLAALSAGAQEWGIAIGPAIVAPWIGQGHVGSVTWIGTGGYVIGTLLLLPVYRQARRHDVVRANPFENAVVLDSAT